MQFRFKNDFIDSTVTLQEDGTVIELFGVGGSVVSSPQKFASVAKWLDRMHMETKQCNSYSSWNEDDGDMHWEDEVEWYTPATYSCSRDGVMICEVESTPEDTVENGEKAWASVYDWVAEIMAV